MTVKDQSVVQSSDETLKATSIVSSQNNIVTSQTTVSSQTATVSSQTTVVSQTGGVSTENKKPVSGKIIIVFVMKKSNLSQERSFDDRITKIVGVLEKEGAFQYQEKIDRFSDFVSLLAKDGESLKIIRSTPTPSSSIPTKKPISWWGLKEVRLKILKRDELIKKIDSSSSSSNHFKICTFNNKRYNTTTTSCE